MNRTVLLSDLTFHSYGSRTPSARFRNGFFFLWRSLPSSLRRGIPRLLSATFLLSILLSAAVPSAWSADLLDAVRRGDHRAVRELLQNHADINAAQPDGSTALVLAADRDDAEVAGPLVPARGKSNARKEKEAAVL